MITIAFLLIIFFGILEDTNAKIDFDEVLFSYYDLPVYNTNDADSLIKYYDSIIEKRDNMPFAYLERGYIHLVNKNVNEAELNFKQSLRLRKGNNDSYLYLAIVYALKKETEKAFDIFNKNRDNIKSNQEGMRLYVISLLYFNKNEACQLYQEYIDKHEDIIPYILSKPCK